MPFLIKVGPWEIQPKKIILNCLVVSLLFLTLYYLLALWITDYGWKIITVKLVTYSGSIPTAGVALLGILIAALTLQQKYNADRREAYYKRVEWALGLIRSENIDDRELGWAVIMPLIAMPDRKSEDSDFVEALQKYIVNIENIAEEQATKNSQNS